MILMRDGVRLATDIYRPPISSAPTIAVRLPYGRGTDSFAGVFLSMARRGYVVVSQDCRGTGDSEPNRWDYYMYEPEDGYDLVEWIVKQAWFDGFLGSCGASYVGQTQWPMALHPQMTTIVPDVSGLGVAVNTVHLHMFVNAYARSVGKGDAKVGVPFYQLEGQMIEETLASGYFNEPPYTPLPEALLERFTNLRGMAPQQARAWLWRHYCELTCAERSVFVKLALNIDQVTAIDVEALPAIFGQGISHDRHSLPYENPAKLCRSIRAPVLMRTGWYDWGLNDALATWDLLMNAALDPIRARCRLIIGPNAHNMPGYHEGIAEHPELHHAHSVATDLELLLRWYEHVRLDTTAAWPKVIFYLMGANEWWTADAWPVPEATALPLYLHPAGRLERYATKFGSPPDSYVYDPRQPTPTVGGSIVSYVYPAGSVDVHEVQQRADVLTYSTEVLEHDLDVVGPIRLVLYATSSAADTDFTARLTDVFPDGRAIQLQNGVLRARYRDLGGEPQLLEPGRIYCLQIDLWATANRFKAGHRLRLDISSADFPRFDRNSNRGGEPGDPIAAQQTIYHDPENPSHLLVSVITCNSAVRSM